MRSNSILIKIGTLSRIGGHFLETSFKKSFQSSYILTVIKIEDSGFWVDRLNDLKRSLIFYSRKKC
jgi:hypothetical protein